MSILQGELVMWTEDITGYNRREPTAVLYVVRPVHHVNHPLGVGIAKVGIMGRTIVYLYSVQDLGQL